MCLSCVSPLQSVMDYWCSTDVTNKDYPCAAVCVPVLPFPPSLDDVKTVSTGAQRSGQQSCRIPCCWNGTSPCPWCVTSVPLVCYLGSWQWPAPGILEEGNSPWGCVFKTWGCKPGLSWFRSWAEGGVSESVTNNCKQILLLLFPFISLE